MANIGNNCGGGGFTQTNTSFFGHLCTKKWQAGTDFEFLLTPGLYGRFTVIRPLQTGNRPYKPETETSLEFANYSHARIPKTLQTKRLHKSGTPLMNASQG